MMARHRLWIDSSCPVDGAADRYECVVDVSGRVVKCEEIVEAVEVLTKKPIFQEGLTQALADRLNATVVTKGTHVKGRVETLVICHPGGAERRDGCSTG